VPNPAKKSPDVGNIQRGIASTERVFKVLTSIESIPEEPVKQRISKLNRIPKYKALPTETKFYMTSTLRWKNHRVSRTLGRISSPIWCQDSTT
jgi:hypothetical protein